MTRPVTLWPLFLVSLASVGFEIALTRYFAVSGWSEYGYWVISIVMVGFSLSGVVMALARDSFLRHATAIRAWLPAAMLAAAAIGYWLATINPFNPLQLQNAATWQPQLWNIAGYYASLLPFFFLAGLFVSLSFVIDPERTGRVYGFDLTGAGAGALVVLGLMFVLHPFALVPALLPALALAALWTPRRLATAAALAALLGGEALLAFGGQAHVSEYKPIYAPLHTPAARVLAERRSPRGDYQLLDDFTERVDTDVSNDSGMLGLAGPPRTFGLYRDGTRVASLPMPGPLDTRYAAASLDALPYVLAPHARALLIGASGGFRVAELLALGAAHVDVREPDAVLRAALAHGLGPSPASARDTRIDIGADSPLAAIPRRYDVIDISADFLDAGDANVAALTRRAIAADLRALRPGGMVSIPVSIRDFPVYADRMLATARASLLAAGIADPAADAVVYRSAWSVRILLRPGGWPPAMLAAARAFCNARSFDLSYAPGIDVAALRASIYNDLPPTSFVTGQTLPDPGGASDAIADEAGAVLDGQPTASGAQFDLRPITLDRPFFYAALRLGDLGTVLRRIEVLPQPEIGALVNVAVLLQAVAIAALVLLVPLLAPGRVRGTGAGALRAVIYFPALGLGFLFLEIYLIQEASLYLADRASAFALVLVGMLIFSGLGSMTAHRFARDPRRGVMLATAVVMLGCAAMYVGLRPAWLASVAWPWPVRAMLVVAVIAPVSLALGVPFPLGLSQQAGTGFLPWAWALNGAFSVVATPLANLIARQAGDSWVLLSAAVLYGVALATFPLARARAQWQARALQAHSRGAG